MTGTSNNETPGPGGDRGSRPPQADVIQPDNGTQRVDVLPEDRHRRPRIGTPPAVLARTARPS